MSTSRAKSRAAPRPWGRVGAWVAGLAAASVLFMAAALSFAALPAASDDSPSQGAAIGLMLLSVLAALATAVLMAASLSYLGWQRWRSRGRPANLQ